MIKKLDEILVKVRNRDMRTFEARVKILELAEQEEQSLREKIKEQNDLIESVNKELVEIEDLITGFEKDKRLKNLLSKLDKDGKKGK